MPGGTQKYTHTPLHPLDIPSTRRDVPVDSNFWWLVRSQNIPSMTQLFVVGPSEWVVELYNKKCMTVGLDCIQYTSMPAGSKLP